MAISFLFSFADAYVCKRVKWYDTIRALLHKLLIFATGSFNIGTNKLREIMFMLSFCSHVGDFFFNQRIYNQLQKSIPCLLSHMAKQEKPIKKCTKNIFAQNDMNCKKGSN